MNTAHQPDGLLDYFPEHKPWVEDDRGYRLLGGRCSSCGTLSFPRAQLCSGCDSEEPPESVELANQGKLYTYTILSVGPTGFPVPRLCGYVDMDDGLRLYGQIMADEVEIGARLALEPGPIRNLPGGRTLISYRFRKV